ncbi:hypothetical protein [Nocardioides sp.]|uniref:hypothetical protein n=1 Tax=Nocardioides sp. TaxID=35761 RepID=UPI0035177FF9
MNAIGIAAVAATLLAAPSASPLPQPLPPTPTGSSQAGTPAPAKKDVARLHEPCRMLPARFQPSEDLPPGGGYNLVVVIPATTCNTPLTDAALARLFPRS